MTKSCDLSVEDIKNYFITAVDTSNNILLGHWNIQHAEQPQSIFLRPVTDAEVLQHIHNEKQKVCWDELH